MFNNLRNKFTIIQVITISIVLFISLSIVYAVISYESTSSTRKELDRIETQLLSNKIDNVALGSIKRDLYYIVNESDGDRETMTNVVVDSEVIEEFLEDGEFKNDKIVMIDDSYWLIRDVYGKYVHSTILLNVTRQVNIVTSLGRTLIVVGLFVLAVMTLISRYFASEAIKPIEETYKKQENFVSDAAHELRTPLTIINTNADVLLSDTSISDSENAKWLRYIKEEVNAMSDLTSELLQLSSNAALEKENLNLSNLLKARLLTFEASMFEQGVSVETDIEEDLEVYGNKKSLLQLINILLVNAMKYSSDKVIKVKLNTESKKTVLSVSNKTEDLDVQDLNNLFDRFYRKEVSRVNNTGKKSYGLGLAIASETCKKHNAKIKAELKDSIISFIVTF